MRRVIFTNRFPVVTLAACPCLASSAVCQQQFLSKPPLPRLHHNPKVASSPRPSVGISSSRSGKNQKYTKRNIPGLHWKDDPMVEAKQRARAAKKKLQQQQLHEKSALELKNSHLYLDESGSSSGSGSDNNHTLHLTNMILTRVQDASRPPLRIHHELFHLVTTPWRLLDEYVVTSKLGRLRRVSTILRFLQDHHVLLHAVLRFNPSSTSNIINNTGTPPSCCWNTSPPFARFVTLGQSKMASELVLRFSKVAPDATLQQLQALERCVFDQEFLASVFDMASLSRLVGSRSDRTVCPVTSGQKATLLCAIIGELSWFVQRTKATDRTHNNALFPPSDALILHVLSAHAVESLYGDIICVLMRPVLNRVRSLWRNFDTSLVEQLVGHLPSSSSHMMVDSSDEQRFVSPLSKHVEKSPRQRGELEKVQLAERDEACRRHVAALEPFALPNDLLLKVVDGNGVCGGPRRGGFFSPTPAKLKWSHLIGDENAACCNDGSEESTSVDDAELHKQENKEDEEPLPKSNVHGVVDSPNWKAMCRDIASSGGFRTV